MKKVLSIVILLLSLVSSANAQFVTIYQGPTVTYSDFIPPGRELELHLSFANQNGLATVTLPPELLFLDRLSDRDGVVEGIIYEGQTATIKYKEDSIGGNIWLFAKTKPLNDLPEIASIIDIETTVQTEFGLLSRSYPFKMLYQKVLMTSDTLGSVTGGDIIGYSVHVSGYPRDDLETATLTLKVPPNTDLLSGSITGAGNATISGNTLTWDSSPPTSLDVSYKVQVWEIGQIHPSVNEIVNDGVFYRITAKGEQRLAPIERQLNPNSSSASFYSAISPLPSHIKSLIKFTVNLMIIQLKPSQVGYPRTDSLFCEIPQGVQRTVQSSD